MIGVRFIDQDEMYKKQKLFNQIQKKEKQGELTEQVLVTLLLKYQIDERLIERALRRYKY